MRGEASKILANIGFRKLEKSFTKKKAELKKLVKDKNIYRGDIDVSCVRDFTNLFENSSRKDFSGIETWDTSGVTTMRRCFCGAKYFNNDISAWDVSKVTDMRYMFKGSENFNQNLDKWQVRSDYYGVEGMFEGTPLEKNLPKWYRKE